MPAPGVLVGRVVGVQTTLGRWMISSTVSGVVARSDTWKEVATSLEESSTLVEGETPRAGDVGL